MYIVGWLRAPTLGPVASHRGRQFHLTTFFLLMLLFKLLLSTDCTFACEDEIELSGVMFYLVEIHVGNFISDSIS